MLSLGNIWIQSKVGKNFAPYLNLNQHAFISRGVKFLGCLQISVARCSTLCMPMFIWCEYQNEVSLVPVPTIETNMCKLLSIVLICHSAKLSAFLSNLSPTYPVHSYVNGSDSIDDLKLMHS